LRGPLVNKLYFGDNLDWLPTIPSESVDLIYLDPPFNSQANYNILYRSPLGVDDNAQEHAFEDTWRWGPAADHAMVYVRQRQPAAFGLLTALNNMMNKSDLMAYLAMMTARLIELHRVLKPIGSLYLHCDPTACHYLKMLLDSVFGAERFVN
jgi:site-specific DNA-methyltransferase (adenine-specific)